MVVTYTLEGVVHTVTEYAVWNLQKNLSLFLWMLANIGSYNIDFTEWFFDLHHSPYESLASQGSKMGHTNFVGQNRSEIYYDYHTWFGNSLVKTSGVW